MWSRIFKNFNKFIELDYPLVGGLITEATIGGPIMVELMGGPRGTAGYINYDLSATRGIADDIVNYSKYFGDETVTAIVTNNPRASFLNTVHSSLKADGTITIRGTMSNKYFSKIYNGTADGLEGYTVVSKTANVSNKGYLTTSGKPIKGQINEIILQKK